MIKDKTTNTKKRILRNGFNYSDSVIIVAHEGPRECRINIHSEVVDKIRLGDKMYISEDWKMTPWIKSIDEPEVVDEVLIEIIERNIYASLNTGFYVDFYAKILTDDNNHLPI